MTAQELEGSLRYLVQEAMKSKIHPIAIIGTMETVKIDTALMILEATANPPAIIPAKDIPRQPGG
jgi:hypothetical protein